MKSRKYSIDLSTVSPPILETMTFDPIARSRLIVFTRYPEPGRTKTRLIPALGDRGAARLQRQMTQYALKHARQWRDRSPSPVLEVRYTGATERQMQCWLGSRLHYRPQGSGDLGDRMARAFEEAFREGANRVAIIGIDCPGVDVSILAKAFDALDSQDGVIGPANDGGYYLIGLRRFVPELLTGIEWGTSQVFRQTLEIAQSLGLELASLPPLDDIDRPEDLPLWECATSEAIGCESISVVIPVLNEADTIVHAIAPLQNCEGVEILVVDGGSGDKTVELVESMGVQTLSVSGGRAAQLNAGAKAASGDILLFLHADTQLPENFDAIARETLEDPDTVAGAFELRVDANLRFMGAIERLVNWRSRFLQLPYGDQALFIRKAVFLDRGGFAPMPIMEDFEFSRRIRRQGKIAIAPAAVLTSGRRWQKLGVLRTTLINQLMVLGYFLGIPSDRLARWYRGRSS